MAEPSASASLFPVVRSSKNIGTTHVFHNADSKSCLLHFSPPPFPPLPPQSFCGPLASVLHPFRVDWSSVSWPFRPLPGLWPFPGLRNGLLRKN
eukprot:scaffold263_cov251-Pinguiococcus_pyrenoidosus.AAC.1